MNHIHKTALIALLSALFLPAEKGWTVVRLGEAEVTVRAGLQEVYDDNVTFSSRNEVDDLISKLSLGVDLTYEGKRHKLVFSGDIRQELFLDNGGFDNTAGSFGASYNVEITEHDRLKLTDDFSYSEDPSTFEDEFGRTEGRYAYLRNTARAEYEHDFSSLWSTRTYYANTVIDASKDTIRDSLLHDAGLDVVRTFSTRLSGLVGYEFLNRSFDDPADSDAYTHSLQLGVRYRITEKLQLDARAGVDFIEAFDGSNTEKPALKAVLTQEIDERTKFIVDFSKRFDTTSYSTDLFDQWRISGSLQHEISRRWRAGVDAFFGEGEYVRTNRDEDLYGLGGWVGYDWSDNAQIQLGYRYSEKDSTNNSEDYSKNTVTFTLKYLF